MCHFLWPGAGWRGQRWAEHPWDRKQAVLFVETLDKALADTGFASGPVLESFETRNIDAYMPTNTDFRDSNPARTQTSRGAA